jgi:hypothetical protein
MDGRPIWLVTNASSGSNADAALEALERCCGEHGLPIAHRSSLPDDELPTPAALDAAGIDRVAVFAGDGTINALIAGLAGWQGAVLVLAGGTMNLLYHRLHGERTVEETIAAVARGEAAMRRPSVVRSRWGDAFAGVLAGPGTSWGRVREAMREAAVTELAASTVEAIGATLTGEQVACIDPPLGKPEGYPLLNLTPRDGGIEVAAYHAENAGEYLEQAWALLKRNFREGPHDVLGSAAALRLASTEGNAFGLLIDGEQVDAAAEGEFALATCAVDLVATAGDDR